MRINWRQSAAILILCSALSTGSAYAQMQSSPMPQSTSATVQVTAKIVAIDKTNRVVTLQTPQGNTLDVQATSAVKRFNELKVGDTVTITYQESVALAIAKPGAAMPASQASPTITRTTGGKPGGTISQTQTATVTIQAIDMNKPSVTVKTDDGRVLTFLVQDKNNLKGFKAGDVVQITYSQAMMINVK